ncbi:MAG: OmpH family outer membrane protein [Verrucomicrobia bacterium]|nr:OmpH family outer membrane protein [Verrucomicrobiota bacterium]
MKRASKILGIGLALGLIMSVQAQAQAKIAIINLKTVFDGYWKTKQSDQLIKQRQQEYQKNRKKMLDDYQKANDEYKKLEDSANDPAISAEEQRRRRQAAEKKLMEIREIEQSITNLDRQFRTSIQDQIKRMRQNILRDIQDIVDQKARTAGYSLVLDQAAQSVNQTPVVLFVSGLPDITNEVLRQLNQNAPAGAGTAKSP